jgi:alkanesulfonate monooxygenase SsuD/methylene tetrahydromethanopterin reductase-like flavin-dependent oxidoreductase (luciferase family)
MSHTIALKRLSFLIPGSFPSDDPRRGLEETLRLFELGEALGYDGAWVRQRHLENSVSSAATLLAAATQRTKRIDLGAAVIQIDYETPFRLAEDLATVDVLSGGRLHVGLSAGRPQLAEWLGDLFPGDHDTVPGQARILALREALNADGLGSEDAVITSAAGKLRPRVQPYAKGLAQRLWYGAGSVRSVDWAAQNGFHLLVGNINTADEGGGFAATQRRHIDRYRAGSVLGAEARVEIGRVILPLHSANAATRARYEAFVQERTPRTHGPQGERGVQFAADIIGSTDEIIASLKSDIALTGCDSLRIELPYNFLFDDYVQILSDIAHEIAPALGRRGQDRVSVSAEIFRTDQIKPFDTSHDIIRKRIAQ